MTNSWVSKQILGSTQFQASQSRSRRKCHAKPQADVTEYRFCVQNRAVADFSRHGWRSSQWEEVGGREVSRSGCLAGEVGGLSERSRRRIQGAEGET